MVRDFSKISLFQIGATSFPCATPKAKYYSLLVLILSYLVFTPDFCICAMKRQRCAILSIACKGYERNQATTLQAPKVRNNGAMALSPKKKNSKGLKM